MLFPELKGKPCGYMNFTEVAKRWVEMNAPNAQENPLLDPKISETVSNEEHARLGIEWSYGGWLENRRELWRGSYLEGTKNFIHLGVDFAVPVGTKVCMERPAQILRIDDDTPEVGGWGSRIIVQLTETPIVLIFAHLSPSIRHKAGDLLWNTIFAEIGNSSQNGGWGPHLHVQAVDAVMYHRKYAVSDTTHATLDGYGSEARLPELAREFPDPMQFIRIN